MQTRAAIVLIAIIISAQIMMHLSLSGNYHFYDELNYLWYGEQIASGKTLYRDFSESHAPGNAFIAALLHQLGDAFFLARAVTGLAQAGVTLCIFIIGSRLSGRRAALIAAILYVAWELVIGGLWFVPEPFISLLMSLAVISALGADWRKGTSGFLIWGFLSGLALLFKFKAAWFALLSAAIIILSRRKLRGAPYRFIAGLITPPAALAAYLASQGAVIQAIEGMIIFNATHVLQDYAGMFALSFIEPYFMLIIIGALACAASSKLISPKTRVGTILLAWMMGGFLLAFPRFALFRLAVGLPPLLIVLGSIIAEPGKKTAVHHFATALAVFSLLLSALFLYAFFIPAPVP